MSDVFILFKVFVRSWKRLQRWRLKAEMQAD